MELNLKTQYGTIGLHVITNNSIVQNIKLTNFAPKRKILKNTINKPILSAIPYIERICPELSIHYNLLYTNTLENILKIQIEDNLKNIKKIFLNLEKIKSNISYFYNIANRYNMHWHKGQLANYYAKILKEHEKITGRRYMPNIFTINGLNLNLSLGKIRTLKNILFLLDSINIYLDKFSKEIYLLNQNNQTICRSKIYTTQNYIQDYIKVTNQKILPIKTTYIHDLSDIKNIKNSIDTPRGQSNIKISILDNKLLNIKIKTASENILKNLGKTLKGSKLNEIEENIKIYDMSLLEVLK